ncbi:transcription initiation factor IIF subunit alpha [Lycium ferocissimum]|uniref:transcription initiation factor IIF subunit alpha n=1 Tax=Lycium ferocissimum TaxID=112874 RepID=UPI0028153963|nr:transcription initiation factor IIF subunit alpha [Lycium ferocissimum]
MELKRMCHVYVQEYNVRACSSNDKNYFIARFASGLPKFSKKKNDSKWTLQKEGLQGRQVTDTLREKYKNKPWLLEDETGQFQFHGQLEGAQSAQYYLLMMQGEELFAIPAGSWYNFNKVAQYKQLTLEEAEEKMKNRRKTADGYQRWMMKAANNGPAAFGEVERFDDKESGSGGARGRKKASGDEDEGNASDHGDEDEEEEAARKNRLGLNKRGDDDEEGPRGGDLDLDDDDIEKGDDWEHEEIFTDDDEAVGIDREEDLTPEIPAPPEIKQDDDDEDEGEEEGGGGLSKSGKELKKLLGKADGLNESDAEDDDDDDDDDAEEDISPVLASKPKEAPKEEPIETSSPSKPAAAGSNRGTPASKSAKTKRKANGDESKPTNGAPLKKVKTETDAKPGKDETPSTAKNSALPKGASTSSKTASSTATGPVTEDEIRAVLLQRKPVTTQDLVSQFKSRLKCKEDKSAFADVLRKISKIQKTASGSSYVVLRERTNQ